MKCDAVFRYSETANRYAAVDAMVEKYYDHNQIPKHLILFANHGWRLCDRWKKNGRAEKDTATRHQQSHGCV